MKKTECLTSKTTTMTKAHADCDYTHHAPLVGNGKFLGQFEIGGAHHRLEGAEVRQQAVVLHDVAGHLAELPQHARFSVHQHSTLDRLGPGQTQFYHVSARSSYFQRDAAVGCPSVQLSVTHSL